MNEGDIYFRAEVEGRWRSVCLRDLCEITDAALALLPQLVAEALLVELRGPKWVRDELRCRWERVAEVPREMAARVVVDMGVCGWRCDVAGDRWFPPGEGDEWFAYWSRPQVVS